MWPVVISSAYISTLTQGCEGPNQSRYLDKLNLPTETDCQLKNIILTKTLKSYCQHFYTKCRCRGGPRLSLTLGMFFALTRSSTSNRTSIGTPNSNRSLIIRSTRSRVFIWSVGAALCFLPRGVGQLLNMTSSMILGVGRHQRMFSNKERRCLLSILQPAGVFSNITNFSGHLGGREGGDISQD